MTPIHKHKYSFLSCGLLIGFLSPAAFAQEAAPAAPPPPATPPAAAPPAAPPAEPAPPPTAEAPAAEAPPAAEGAAPAAEAPAAEPAPTEAVGDRMEKTMNIGLWGRVDAIVSDGNDKLNDISSNGVFEFHVGGSVHKYVNYTANLIATYGGGPGTIMGTAGLLDGIIQLDFADAFHIWGGRMLVPSDRANFSGTWFAAPWMYPGSIGGGPPTYGPRQGPFGRNDGFTVWGQAAEGLFKYYVGAYDLHDVTSSPLISARLNLALLNPEPGYYHSSTYYGKDILAIGASVQSKKNGSVGGGAAPPPNDDYMGFSVDALFEKDLKESGVFDAEGAFYKFNGDNEGVDGAWYGLVSYLLPGEIGIGKLQPLFRMQQIMPSAAGADDVNIFEGQLGYVIDSYSARMALGFQHASTQPTKYNGLYLGVQIEK